MLLIHNIACLATMDDSLGEIADAAVLIDGDTVYWCGERVATPHAKVSRVIDAKQCLVLPGLIDCHSHLVFAGSRADEFARRMAGESYADIMAEGGGIMATVRAVAQACDEELISLASQRADNILAQGVTTLEVKSGYGLSLDSELRLLAIIKKLNQEHALDLHPTFMGAHVVPPEYKNRPDEYVDLVAGPMLAQVAQQNLAIDCDVFCEEGAFSVPQALTILQRAHALGLGLRAHVQQLGPSGGVSLLRQLPMKSLSHADFLSQADVALLAQSGTVVEVLPIAGLFVRGAKMTPVKELLEAGVSLAIGTDFNPGSAMCHDLILAARLGVTHGGFSIDAALRAITSTAARALGRSDIGVIKAGAKADILITRMQNKNSFFYDWTQNPVQAVIKNGQSFNQSSLLS